MKNLIAALIEAQREFKPAIKDSDNPFFHSKYIDLESAWSAAKEALWKNGLTVIQHGDIHEASGQPVLVTRLVHTSGEEITGRLPLPVNKANNPQDLGASVTYVRRFGYMAIVMLCPEDDDGNEASGKVQATDRSGSQSQPKAQDWPPSTEMPVPLDAVEKTADVVTIEAVPGTNKKTGKPYVVFRAKLNTTDGEALSATTFDRAYYNILEMAKQLNQQVRVTVVKSKYGLDIKGVMLVQPAVAVEDEGLPFAFLAPFLPLAVATALYVGSRLV